MDSRTAAVTTDVLKEYKEMISNTTSDLEEHLQEIDKRVQALSLRGDMILEDAAKRERMSQEKDSIKQCLAICAQASDKADQVRPSVFKDVPAAKDAHVFEATNVFKDAHIAKDAHQLIVSTLGDLILAKRVTSGLSAKQWLGQMSDTTQQQLSRDLGIDLLGGPAMDKFVKPQSELGARFADEYGAR
jgi:hypothetical protein